MRCLQTCFITVKTMRTSQGFIYIDSLSIHGSIRAQRRRRIFSTCLRSRSLCDVSGSTALALAILGRALMSESSPQEVPFVYIIIYCQIWIFNSIQCNQYYYETATFDACFLLVAPRSTCSDTSSGSYVSTPISNRKGG